ncbi:MAG: hypothetical protein WC890_06350 [Candidatus Margulisiibacteriota bacterium]
MLSLELIQLYSTIIAIIKWIISNSAIFSGFLLILGIILQTYAAYVFSLTWLLSDKRIEDLAGTYLDSNPYLFVFLRKTKSDTYKGLFFLIFGGLALIISSLMQLFL